MAFVEFEKVSKTTTPEWEIPACGTPPFRWRRGDLRHCRGLRCRKDHAAEYFGGGWIPSPAAR